MASRDQDHAALAVIAYLNSDASAIVEAASSFDPSRLPRMPQPRWLCRMRIATFNVNGINARLSALLRWLSETSPDIVCLQELKAPEERFPAAEIYAAGYDAIWHGQKSWTGVVILAKGNTSIERARVLPGDPDDAHSRYIEADVGGLIVGCLYLPNGNPAPGPKFNYKLDGSNACRSMRSRCFKVVCQ